MDSQDPHFCTTQDLERLGKFSRIIAKAVDEDEGAAERAPSRSEAWESYLERTPVEDMEREKLLLLLNRNEWNIARVARLMAVTRRTIYLRLHRYNIPRERVPKTRPRRVTTERRVIALVAMNLLLAGSWNGCHCGWRRIPRLGESRSQRGDHNGQQHDTVEDQARSDRVVGVRPPHRRSCAHVGRIVTQERCALVRRIRVHVTVKRVL